MPSIRSLRSDQPVDGLGHLSTAASAPSLPGDPPVSSGFGQRMATYVVVSSMVGVGVLTTSGYTVAAVGSNQIMLGLWLVGGVIALCGALTIAELSAALPASGGEYIYLYEAYGPVVAFLSGWVSFMIGFAAPIAAASFAAASYMLAPSGPRAATDRDVIKVRHPGDPRLLRLSIPPVEAARARVHQR